MPGEIFRRFVELGSTESRVLHYKSQSNEIIPTESIRSFCREIDIWRTVPAGPENISPDLFDRNSGTDSESNAAGLETVLLLPDSICHYETCELDTKSGQHSLTRNDLRSTLQKHILEMEKAGRYAIRSTLEEVKTKWNHHSADYDFSNAKTIARFHISSVDRLNLKAMIEKFNNIGVRINDLQTSLDSFANLCTSGLVNRDIIIHIGHLRTNVFGLNPESQSAVSGSVRVGGHHFTADLQMALQKTAREAEDLKRQYGITQTSGYGGVDCSRYLIPRLDEWCELIEPLLPPMDDELPRQILLAGGGSKLPGLAPYLKRQFGREISFFNPFDNDIPMRSVDPSHGPIYAGALSHTYSNTSSEWSNSTKFGNWVKSFKRWVEEVS